MLSQIIITVGALGFGVLAAFYLIQRQRIQNVQKKALGKSTPSNFKNNFNIIAQATYNQLLRIPGLRYFILRARRRLETLAVYDEYTLRREVMKIFFSLFAVILLIFTILLLIRPTFLVVFWVLLGVLFISGVLIDFFVYRVEARLLTQLKEFNNRVRFFYQQTKMVDDAIFDAIQFVGPEMRIQAERIYNILTSVDPEKELIKYEEVAPTRFLKVIAGMSLLVKNQGDKFSDKGSAYLQALSAINQELNNEILYRSKLSYRLRSLSTLTIVPIFFALPIKNWAISTFPSMESFYSSRIGFLAEVAVYSTSIVSYLIVRKMREATETSFSVNVKRFHWEQKLFDKFPIIEKICIAMSPTPYTKRFFKLQKLIKDANAPYKVEWLTLHRIIIGLLVFVFLTSGFVYAHYRESNSVLNNTLPETLFAGTISEDEKGILQEQTDFDKQVINHLKEIDLELSEDEMKAYIADQLGVQVDDPSVKVAFTRITDKWEVVKDSFFKWYELLVILVITVVASNAPIYTLQFKRYMRFKEMETEVHQLLILIGSLQEFERISVYNILEWMERFSIVFKQPIQICLQDFDSGPDEALTQLTVNVTFEPFQQIVERLKLALVRISVQESFDDINMEREFYLEQRKDSQNQSIDSKGVIGHILGMAPLMCLVFLYLVIPLIYLSVIESTKMMQYLQ